MSEKWRTRKRGSPRQIGQRFRLTSTQKLKANLPKIQGVRQTYPTGKTVDLSLKVVPTAKLVPTEDKRGRPEFETSVRYIMDMYRRGETLPPILIHKRADGSYAIMDGHARVEAYRRLGVTRVPCVENSFMEKLSNVAKWTREKAVSGIKKAWHIARRLPSYAEKAAVGTARVIGRAEALPSEIRESYEEGKAERPWREKGEVAKYLGEEREEPRPREPEDESLRYSGSPLLRGEALEKLKKTRALGRLEDIEKEPHKRKARVVVDVE
jgi:hypothetical protein